MRPWTRLEVRAAGTGSGGRNRERPLESSGASSSMQMLESEFAREKEVLGGSLNREMKLESVYTREWRSAVNRWPTASTSGKQRSTTTGRPFQEGFNNVTGFSGYAAEGKYTFYVRGEYQHAPSAPTYSLFVRQAIASVDANPLQPAQAVAEWIRPGWRKPTLGSMSRTADDVRQAKPLVGAGRRRCDAVQQQRGTDLHVPRQPRHAFAAAMDFRMDGTPEGGFFLWPTCGNEFPQRPVMHGEKISFKPTRNLEVGSAARWNWVEWPSVDTASDLE